MVSSLFSCQDWIGLKVLKIKEAFHGTPFYILPLRKTNLNWSKKCAMMLGVVTSDGAYIIEILAVSNDNNEWCLLKLTTKIEQELMGFLSVIDNDLSVVALFLFCQKLFVRFTSSEIMGLK